MAVVPSVAVIVAVTEEEIVEVLAVVLPAVVLAVVAALVVLKYSSSPTNTKAYLSLKVLVTISYVPRTLFLENQSTMKKESVLMVKMERKLSIGYGILTDPRLLLLCWVE